VKCGWKCGRIEGLEWWTTIKMERDRRKKKWDGVNMWFRAAVAQQNTAGRTRAARPATVPNVYYACHSASVWVGLDPLSLLKKRKDI